MFSLFLINNRVEMIEYRDEIQKYIALMINKKFE